MAGLLDFPDPPRSRTVLRGPWVPPAPPPPTPVHELAVELAGLCLCDALGTMGSHYHDLVGNAVDAWDADARVTENGHLGVHGTDTELTLRPRVPLFISDHYVTRDDCRRKVPILATRENWRPESLINGMRRLGD